MIATLRNRLPYLQLDDAILTAFARDVIRRRYDNDVRVHVVALLGWPLSNMLAGLNRGMYDGLMSFEETICSLFLLSTDFFTRSNDAQPIIYVGFWDPLERSCENPFATLA